MKNVYTRLLSVGLFSLGLSALGWVAMQWHGHLHKIGLARWKQEDVLWDKRLSCYGWYNMELRPIRVNGNEVMVSVKTWPTDEEDLRKSLGGSTAGVRFTYTLLDSAGFPVHSFSLAKEKSYISLSGGIHEEGLTMMDKVAYDRASTFNLTTEFPDYNYKQ